MWIIDGRKPTIVRGIEALVVLLCAIAVVSGVLSLVWIADLALVFPALALPVGR